MIYGIGTDVIEINRINGLAERPAFIRRVYTDQEAAYANGRSEALAGMFAAKEAFSKAVGTGFRSFSLRDVEIVHDELGKPDFRLYGRAAALWNHLRFMVSISHSQTVAIAMVVALSETERDYP